MGYIVVPATETNATSSVLYGVDVDFQQANIFASTTTIDREAVSQFKNLLLTYPGEHYFDPQFGCLLKKIIFEPNVYIIKQRINDVIQTATSKFCPLIQIEELNVITAEDDPTMNNDVKITIAFTVRNSPRGQRISITGTETGTINVTEG